MNTKDDGKRVETLLDAVVNGVPVRDAAREVGMSTTGAYHALNSEQAIDKIRAARDHEIRQQYLAGVKIAQICTNLHISQGTVYAALQRSGPGGEPITPSRQSYGPANKTDAEIISMYKQGIKVYTIAALASRSTQYIYKLVSATNTPLRRPRKSPAAKAAEAEAAAVAGAGAAEAAEAAKPAAGAPPTKNAKATPPAKNAAAKATTT